MPQMKSLRTFTLATTLGHMVHFEAETPTFVPEPVVPFALEKGCVMCDAADTPFFDDLSKAKVEFVGDVRSSIIYLAIDRVATKNDPKDFDGSNYPRAKVVADMLGFDVQPSEVAPLYQQYLSLKQDGKEYPLAPQAAAVLDVMDAANKSELLLLAEEQEIDAAKAKGLSARDLRKLLMVKLSGVAAD